MDRQILFVFKVGHSVQRKAKPTLKHTHHWRCYVDSWSPRYPLSAFVKKVTFKLHDTFDNPKQVVRQAPFAIEEDGFGNFRLQIEVAFFDCVTNFPYDLTLFDDNALHTYRTVRIDPAPEDWDIMIQLGGIVIPRNNSQHDVHKVVQTIQSSTAVETLHPYSFFPFLEPRVETDLSSPHTSSTGSVTHPPMDIDGLHGESSGWGHEQPVCFSDDQHQQLQQQKISHPPSQAQPPPPPPLPQRQSYSSTKDYDLHEDTLRSVDRFLSQRPLPQKHKKKLQLLHEAQLQLEDAQKRQAQWAAADQLRSSPSANSPRYSLAPLSPNIPTWPCKPSPIHQTPVSESDVLPSQSGDRAVHRATDSTVSTLPSHESTLKPNPSPSPGAKGSSAPSDGDSNQSKRIVLKLSRLGSGNKLTVSSSHLDESAAVEADRKERRRRKKERREQLLLLQQQKHLEQQQSQSTSETLLSDVCTMSTTVPISSGVESVENCDRLRFEATSSPSNEHHDSHSAGPDTNNEDGADDEGLLLSPRKVAKLKRRKRSRPHRDHSDYMHPQTLMSKPMERDNPMHIFDTNPLDHYEDGTESQKTETVDERHTAGVGGGDASERDGGAETEVDSVRYADHSHLLLDQEEHEFDEVLSRSLFSQCHDSTNPDSPFVDMFGDEEQVRSDASIQSLEEELGNDAKLQTHRIRRSSVFDTDGDDEDDEATDPLRRVETDSSKEIGRGYRDSAKPQEPIIEPRAPTVPEIDAVTVRKKTKKMSKLIKDQPKDKISDDVERVSKSFRPNNAKNLQSATQSAGCSAKRASNVASDMPTSIQNLSQKSSRDSTPSVEQSGDTFESAVSDKRNKSANRQTHHDKSNSRDMTAAVKTTKKKLDSTSLPTIKPLKSGKRDRDAIVIGGSVSQPGDSDLHGSIQSSKFKASETNTTKLKSEKNVTKNTVKEPKAQTSSITASQSLKSKSRPVSEREKKMASPMNQKRIKLPQMFSEQDVELSSLSSSSRASSPSSAASSCSSSPTPPMSSVTVPPVSTIVNVGNTITNCAISTRVTEVPTSERASEGKPQKTESKIAAKLDKSERKKTAKSEVTTVASTLASSTVVNSKDIAKRTPAVTASRKQHPVAPVDSNESKTTVGKPSQGHITHTLTTTTIPSTVTNTDSETRETQLSNQELELLFDRLLRLKQPQLAIRMGEILLAYQTATTNKTSLENNSETKASNPRSAVKVLYEEPRVIAFNLRRLPLACLMQLSDLIAEDEAMTMSDIE